MVSQPFSSAKVSASASAASAPVANSAIEADRPVLVLAPGQNLRRGGIGGGQHHGEDRKRDRTIEMRDAGIERDQQRQRREDSRCRPDHGDPGRADERNCAKNPASAETGGEDRRGDQMQRDRTFGRRRTDAGQRAARQHQHVRIGPHRPFAEHDEDKDRRRADRAGGRRRAPGDEQVPATNKPNVMIAGVGMKTRSARSWWRRTDRPQANLTKSARPAPDQPAGRT